MAAAPLERQGGPSDRPTSKMSIFTNTLMAFALTKTTLETLEFAVLSIKIAHSKHLVMFNLTPKTLSFFILITCVIQSRLCCSNIKVNNMEPTRSPLLPAPFAVPVVQAFAQESHSHAA